MNADVLSALFTAPTENGRFFGVTIGIVTNNKDEEGMGRVKVRFPYLSDKDESFWARVVSPMAGAERGIFFLPEVGDEVLVIFEQGSLEFPYILGALWNGKDIPPETNADGKNNLRMIKSRSGHLILLDDTEGEEAISIVDKTGKNGVVISSKENVMTVGCDGDIVIEAKGKLQLKADGLAIDGNTEITGDLKITGDVEITGNVDIK